MEELTESLLVPLYFLQVVLGTFLLSWWFSSKKDKTLKMFGMGMLGYALGLSAWTALVLLKPDDLQPLILLGAVPFLLAHFAYARVAYKDIDFTKASLLTLLVAGAIGGTFFVRTFLYPSEAYFSSDGLLFFGLHPMSIAFYIFTMSVTFLPAISVVAKKIKDKMLRKVMQVTLTTLFINAVILVSGNDGELLLINGVVMTVALLFAWVSAFKLEPPK